MRSLRIVECLGTAVIALAMIALALGPQIVMAQAAATAKAADLQGVLAKLNAAAAKFVSAQADFSADQYQAVVQEDDVQTGTIYFDRSKGSTLMAADFAKLNGQSAPKVVVYNGSELQFYQPEIKQMTILHAGSNRSEYESFLTLGFGGSGSDLQANWNITLAGMETMDGIEVAQLDLKPKAQNVQNMFSHVTIWVDPARAVSLKQVFYEPSGDRKTETYTNIRYNQSIPADVFHIQTAAGTTVQVK